MKNNIKIGLALIALIILLPTSAEAVIYVPCDTTAVNSGTDLGRLSLSSGLFDFDSLIDTNTNLLNTASILNALRSGGLPNVNITNIGSERLDDQIDFRQDQLRSIERYNDAVRRASRQEISDQRNLQRDLERFNKSTNQDPDRLSDIYEKFQRREAERERRLQKASIDYQYGIQFGL